jgi:hypothetical protein
MDNAFQNVHLATVGGNSQVAMVKVLAQPRFVRATTELRGRLMGPRCAYATTVEVAYPLRAHPDGLDFRLFHSPQTLNMDVIIPEPSWWEPECPFLYEGPIELWEDDVLCDTFRARLGLRQVQLKKRGFFLNGRPITLRGNQTNHLSEDEARRYRTKGLNVLLADAVVGCAVLWEAAERLGFLVLGRVRRDEETLKHIQPFLFGSNFTFGWILSQDVLERPEEFANVADCLAHKNKKSLGVELLQPPIQELPETIGFVVCSADLLPRLEGISQPKVLLGPVPDLGTMPPPGILGWVE